VLPRVYKDLSPQTRPVRLLRRTTPGCGVQVYWFVRLFVCLGVAVVAAC
jgi:hypothetical protein